MQISHRREPPLREFISRSRKVRRHSRRHQRCFADAFGRSKRRRARVLPTLASDDPLTPSTLATQAQDSPAGSETAPILMNRCSSGSCSNRATMDRPVDTPTTSASVSGMYQSAAYRLVPRRTPASSGGLETPENMGLFDIRHPQLHPLRQPYGSEGWGFKFLRAHRTKPPLRRGFRRFRGHAARRKLQTGSMAATRSRVRLRLYPGRAAPKR